MDKAGDQEASGQCQGQSQNVYDANQLVSGQDPDGYFQVVEEHGDSAFCHFTKPCYEYRAKLPHGRNTCIWAYYMFAIEQDCPVPNEFVLPALAILEETLHLNKQFYGCQYPYNATPLTRSLEPTIASAVRATSGIEILSG